MPVTVPNDAEHNALANQIATQAITIATQGRAISDLENLVASVLDRLGRLESFAFDPRPMSDGFVQIVTER